MVGRAVKQPLDLYADRPCPDNNKVGEQAQIGKQTGKRQRQKTVHPAQKGPRAFLALGKIAVQQQCFQQHHAAVANRDRKEKALQNRRAEEEDQ